MTSLSAPIAGGAATPPTPPRNPSPPPIPGSPLDYALRYAGLGLPVLPLYGITPDGHCACHKGAGCDSPGKHPRTVGGLKDATTDPETIRRWWNAFPHANIGIRTGARPDGGGIVVLDLDPRNGGEDSFAELERTHGPLPSTIQVITGGGGRHYYFGHPGGHLANKSNLLPGIDVKADGGYVVAPPSRHISGGTYRWA